MPAKKTTSVPGASTRRTSSSQIKGTCFAIMPFGGWFDDYWKRIYRPAIEAAKLTPHRADDVFRPGTIMSDVWRVTRGATVLLADLTTRNGNVFYELGLAHAIGKAAVLVSESIEDVPFDLRGLRVLLYDKRDPDWGQKLRGSISRALRETIANPSAAVPSTFVEDRDDTDRPRLPVSQRELLQLRQDIELVKRQLATRDGGRQDPLLEQILEAWATGKTGNLEDGSAGRPASLLDIYRQLPADGGDGEPG